MTTTAAASGAQTRRVLVTGVIGGGLWALYGVLELVEPWGPDTRYDDARAYDVVVDGGLHHLYSLPGSAALLLCAGALLVLLQRLGVSSRAARGAGWSAAGLAVCSAAGVVAGSDPVFTATRILGTLVLGVGVLAAGRAAGRTPGLAAWRLPLLALGLLAISLLLVWPLVFALQWFTPGAGAATFALHGAGWCLLAAAARDDREHVLPAALHSTGARLDARGWASVFRHRRR